MTTPGLSRLPLRRAALAALAAALLGASPAAAVCVGDCNGDGRVSIAELQACVNLGVGDLPAPPCAAADQNNDGTVDPNEVDRCVQGFLDADTCPMVFTPAPTNTPPPTATGTNTVPPTSTRTLPPTLTPTLTPTPTNTAVPLGQVECTLKTGSQLFLQTAVLPLALPATGSFSIDCGSPGADGTAPCACELIGFNPVVIPSIGDVCVNPATGCAPGLVDCDGGSQLDVVMTANHKIGTCTSDAQCATACDAYCTGFGQGYSRQSYGCEGYCQGGDRNEMECSVDTECPGGQCPGRDPVAHFDTCNCVCAGERLGNPSRAGGLFCNLGTQINVELPSDGDCGDTVTIRLAPVCGGVTTENSTGVVLNANNTANATIPATGAESVQGAVVTCDAFAADNIDGLTLRGQLGFFDSSLGDIRSRNTFVCQ